LGITEQTDAVVIVVSEENRQISLVERARIVRNLNESQLTRAITALLNPSGSRRTLFGRGPDRPEGVGARAPRLGQLGGMVARRRPRRGAAPPEDDSAAAASVRPSH
jgi:hypothetical protein